MIYETLFLLVKTAPVKAVKNLDREGRAGQFYSSSPWASIKWP